MKIQHFLQHHGLDNNPFADEDAQSDLVFKNGCIRQVYHPAWDKIYGDPSEPATAVVFGEKGSGKTAIRLQMVRHLTDFNADHPGAQAFVVQYDDFNPFLDRFREHLSRRGRRPDRALAQWRLWDHMDAVLALGTTQLVDRLLGERNARHPAARDEPLDIAVLDRPRRRDVLLLAACYDQSSSEGREERFAQLRKRLGVRNFKGWWPLSVGILVTLVVFLIIAVSGYWSWWLSVWPWLAIVAGWVPWAARGARWNLKAWRIARSTRALNQPVGPLARMLLALSPTHTAGQPLPAAARTDDRYELLGKLQGVLRALRMPGLVVLVDRVDEPYIVNGAPDLMKALIWPLLDNKFLKHAGLGVKMLLPIELERLIDREGHDFHQRARLDKQNMVRSLPWTGQALYDLAAARLRACAGKGSTATLTDWFEPSVTSQRLTEAFATLRVPRNLFKFLYRLLTKHCNAQSDEKPAWKISSGTFESELALYQRDQEAFDRGTGAG